MDWIEIGRLALMGMGMIALWFVLLFVVLSTGDWWKKRRKK